MARDKRVRLKVARHALTAAQHAVTDAESAVRRTARRLPQEGSLWRRHWTVRNEYEADYVWTFRHVAWDERSQQAAVVSTTIDGKPYFRVMPMAAFLLEHVKTSRASGPKELKSLARRLAHARHAKRLAGLVAS